MSYFLHCLVWLASFELIYNSPDVKINCYWACHLILEYFFYLKIYKMIHEIQLPWYNRSKWIIMLAVCVRLCYPCILICTVDRILSHFIMLLVGICCYCLHSFQWFKKHLKNQFFTNWIGLVNSPHGYIMKIFKYGLALRSHPMETNIYFICYHVLEVGVGSQLWCLFYWYWFYDIYFRELFYLFFMKLG